MKNWFKSGDPWIWLTASAVSISMIMTFGLLLLIAVRGMGYFWPSNITEMQYQEPGGAQVKLIGEIYDEEEVPLTRLDKAAQALVEPGEIAVTRYLLKTGNRELYGLDFRWIIGPGIKEQRYPEELLAVERREWGNFYGYLVAVKENGQIVAQADAAGWEKTQALLARAEELHSRITDIEKHKMGAINYALEQLRLRERKLALKGDTDPAKQADIAEQRADYAAQADTLKTQLADLYQQINRDSIRLVEMTGKEIDIQLANIVHINRPNSFSLFRKVGFYLAKIWEFVSTDPREANTEGGIFPAIFGTVMMVFVMSMIVTPFGVVAAVYLREYAKQGFLTRTIRIAVNNLAGVPAIVYGVFGLGFFVYFMGGGIDRMFYPEAAPAPVFGTPGLLWASLTLALLTVPVVIVATEEGLSRIPSAIREGSLALGATKAETLWRTVMPMASPAMMTGLILAIARAAGEVAPLMLVGVVKLAPSLPLDGNSPFLHLDRKFMHLGFHIYDVGFQSPNVEAARPLVYATSFLLVLVIVVLNLTAIWIRNRLREKYKSLESV